MTAGFFKQSVAMEAGALVGPIKAEREGSITAGGRTSRDHLYAKTFVSEVPISRQEIQSRFCYVSNSSAQARVTEAIMRIERYGEPAVKAYVRAAFYARSGLHFAVMNRDRFADRNMVAGYYPPLHIVLLDDNKSIESYASSLLHEFRHAVMTAVSSRETYSTLSYLKSDQEQYALWVGRIRETFRQVVSLLMSEQAEMLGQEEQEALAQLREATSGDVAKLYHYWSCVDRESYKDRQVELTLMFGSGPRNSSSVFSGELEVCYQAEDLLRGVIAVAAQSFELALLYDSDKQLYEVEAAIYQTLPAKLIALLFPELWRYGNEFLQLALQRHHDAPECARRYTTTRELEKEMLHAMIHRPLATVESGMAKPIVQHLIVILREGEIGARFLVSEYGQSLHVFLSALLEQQVEVSWGHLLLAEFLYTSDKFADALPHYRQYIMNYLLPAESDRELVARGIGNFLRASSHVGQNQLGLEAAEILSDLLPELAGRMESVVMLSPGLGR